MDARMLFGEAPQQIGEKTGRERRENAYAEMTFFGTAHRIHDLGTFVDIAKNLSSSG
jgi:hypothetical protein